MKNNEVTGRTLEVILNEANDKVNALNKEKDSGKRDTLVAEVDKLCKDYNDLSLLTVYAASKSEALPIMALAKVCTYHTIRKKKSPGFVIIDGVTKSVDVYSLVESDTNLNILKFIKWLEDRNFKMPKGWITNMSAVKADIIDQWQAFDKSKDEAKFKIKRIKELTQTMVNDLGFIEGAKGNNALVVKGDHVKPMLKFANRKTGVLAGETLTPKIWDDMLLTLLHSIATGSAFENTYGGSAVFKEEASDETPAEEPATEEAQAE